MNPFRHLFQRLRAAGSGGGTGGNPVSRIWRTAVLWSWAFNVLRLGSILIILPLLTRLPSAEFGLYYLLLSIVAITPLIDMGFANAVERAVSYSMAGARQLSAHGLPLGDSDGKPNFQLLWKLVHTMRTFYRALTVLLLIVMGSVGTVIVSQSAHQTSNPAVAWLAWGVALLNAAFEIYSSWWNVVLRGMNHVVTGSRILCLGYALKMVLSCAFLLAGAGVLSIFAAGLVSSALIRSLSRRISLKLLPPEPDRPSRKEILGMLRILWPNSWRVGLQLITSYVTALAFMLICEDRFGLAGAGTYGFSLNIAALIQGMAGVWVHVKWPMIGQLRSRNDLAALQRLFWSRIWLAKLTHLGLALTAVLLLPLLISLGGIRKEVLPSPWFAVLLLNSFLETQMILWGTFLTTENKVPTLWPIALTNLVNLVLVLALLNATGLGIGVFALAPLIGGVLFNYWHWPKEGARNLRSSWFRYMFRPPHSRGEAAPESLARV